MQRMAFEPGLEPPDLEEENRRARNEVLRNVAIFGAIVILLRVGRLHICIQSWGTVSFPDHFCHTGKNGSDIIHGNYGNQEN